MAVCARAEFLTIDQKYSGIDCASCVTAIEKGIKRIRGVETVEVVAAEAVAKVKLAPSNTAGLDRVRDAIKATGYTPDTARVTVRGRVVEDAGVLKLEISGSTAHLVLRASAKELQPGADPVLLEGIVSVPPNPREPAILEVTAVRKDDRR
jgi:copper chaperone CopZ